MFMKADHVLGVAIAYKNFRTSFFFTL